MQKILINLGFLVLSLNTFAQKDTISNATEKEDPHYKLYIEDQKREIKALLKINLLSVGAIFLNCALEVKLSDSWTWETYIKYGEEFKSSFDTSSQFGKTHINYSGQLSGVGEIEQDIKYYYNFKRREKLGKITNGFCGNYIAIRLFGSMHTYDIEGYSDDYNTYGVGINYGIQRRIGKIGYVEIFGGIRYQFREIPEKFEEVIINGVKDPFPTLRKSTRQELLPTIGLRAGFDIAWKKRH
jgi:hypothetical protein